MTEKKSAPAQIETQMLNGTAGAKDGALRVEIEYPVLSGCANAARLNAFYRSRAEARYRACGGQPRRCAERQRQMLQKDGGFAPLRAGSSFSVMYNQGGFLSIFCDSWEELGCDGSFLRREAHTWELATGQIVPAGRFFRQGSPWRQQAVRCIVRQIEEWEQGQEGAFFAGARRECRTLWGYYLADDGIVFFYPAESLGPRSLGIPSFLVRYSDFGPMLAARL